MNEFNYVGIDTSLSSTGMYILTKSGEEFYYNYKNTEKLTKWHHTCSFVTYRDYEILKFDDFSDNEVGKLIKYDQVTDTIIKDILRHCDPKETKVGTENYSYSSSAGMIIHLVTYGTMLRQKILRLDFADFTVYPPSTLKQKTCELVYGQQFNSKGKKIPSRNTIGIAGGSFKKHEMLQSIFDCELNSKLKEILLPRKSDILGMKAIPKPIDDIVDSQWLVYIMM